MNASLQMLVEPMMFVITPLDRTGVNVQMDLLLIPVHRTHWIQFVSVRRWIIKKWQKKKDSSKVYIRILAHIPINILHSPHIFHLRNARSQKLMYVNLKSKFISLGKSVLLPATFLLHGIKLAHILHLRDYRLYNINDIVVLVYVIYSYFKDSAFTAVIDGFSLFHEECMFFLTFVDLNECQSPDACGANDVCNNTIGSYRCECANGFVADSGAQDPLNPVCIGKKMDNQKMTEKRDRDSVSCNIKVHELLIRLVSCTLALRNKLHQIINVSLLDWSWSFILAKEDNGIFCPTKFIAMLRFEVVGAMTKLLKRWCLVIVNYNTFKSDLFW